MNHPAAHIGTAADFFAQQHDEDDTGFTPQGSDTFVGVLSVTDQWDAEHALTTGPGAIWQIPDPNPMERIAMALEAIAGGNRRAGTTTVSYDDVSITQPTEDVHRLSEKLRDLHEIIADLESDRQTLTQVVADIDEALGKSKAGPALAAKAVIEAWRNPQVPVEHGDAMTPADNGQLEPHPESMDHHGNHLPTGEECNDSCPAVAGSPVVKPVQPANDAPVEAWREYARSQGFAGPEIDKANRSQIRTALGVVQPVEGGA